MRESEKEEKKETREMRVQEMEGEWSLDIFNRGRLKYGEREREKNRKEQDTCREWDGD